MNTIYEKGTAVILKYGIDKEYEDDTEFKEGEEGVITRHVNHRFLDETPCYMIKFSNNRMIQLTQHGFSLKSDEK